MIDLRDWQRKLHAWCIAKYGPQTLERRGLVMGEELGEVQAAILKRAEGESIKEGHDIQDELPQLLIGLLVTAECVGLDMETALEQAFAKVNVSQPAAPLAISGRFRKRPVVIEAVQWDGWHNLAACQALSPHRPNEDVKIYVNPAAAGDRLHTLSVETLEGRMIAQPGDWIIRGVKGEVYPCKPDIFAATYESIDEQA